MQTTATSREVRIGLTLSLLLALLTLAALSPWRGTEVQSSGDVVVVDGVTNAPLSEKVEIARHETAIGSFRMESYDSRLGGCVDVVYPDQSGRGGVRGAADGHREAQCLAGSGILADEALTMEPGTGSPDAMTTAGWNASLTHDGIGFVVYGLVHPSVKEIRVEPFAGTAEVFSLRPIDASNAEDLSVYFFATAPEVMAFRVLALDDDGCVVDAETLASGRPDPAPVEIGRC